MRLRAVFARTYTIDAPGARAYMHGLILYEVYLCAGRKYERETMEEKEKAREKARVWTLKGGERKGVKKRGNPEPRDVFADGRRYREVLYTCAKLY